MSGLAAVLAGRHDAGVHLWHNALHVPDIQHAVEHAGWQFGYVDGVALETKKEVLGAIGAALDLPDDGGDLDTLRDSLRDLSKPTVLLWDGWGSLARAEPEAFENLCRVLERPDDDADTSFEVLLRGPGPTDGLESLD